MTIATLADYQAAAKQTLRFSKTPAITYNSNYGSYWKSTGSGGQNFPSAGSAPGNTANGLVPDNTTTGAISINAFSGRGHVTAADMVWGTLAAARALVYDRLFHAGAYAYNANTTLASQPSFSARIPGGTDYTGLQLWLEIETTFTGAPTITVTYTDQSGNTGHSTSISSSITNAGQQAMYQFALAAGDSGIQKIESVVATVASAGTFNLIIARPIVTLVQSAVRQIPVLWIDQTGMPEVFPTSCLAVTSIKADPTFGPDISLELASA